MAVFQGQFRRHKIIRAENAYYPSRSLLGNNPTASRVGVARLMFVRNWTENGLYDNFNMPGLIGNHRFGGAKAVFRSWSIRRLTPIFEFSARALL